MLLWLGVILASILLIYLKIYKPLQKWKDLGIPHKKPIPIFGNMASIIFQRQSMADLALDTYNIDKSSRYIGMYSFNSPSLIIKDLDLIKQIGIKDFDYFVDHRTFFTDESGSLFAKNLLALEGQQWRNMRATLSPAFTGSKMRSMFVLMSDCAEQFTNYFKDQIKSDESIIIEMKDILSRYANDVIATCAFGITCDSMREKDNEFYEMGNNITSFGFVKFFKFFGYMCSPALMKLLKVKLFSEEMENFFHNIVTSNIKIREEQGIIRPDMIHLLMEARKGKLKHEDNKVKDEDAGFATVEESEVGKNVQDAKNYLSDNDITSQAFLFLLAGFDTISTAMCHMAYELALNVDVQEKLLKEVDGTFEKCKGKITYDAIVKMKYLDMVLSETLRKWPALVQIDRVCTNSYTIPAQNPGERPIHLEKGDVIFFPCYGMHRDPQYYPNPDKFDPERFNDENKVNINPLTYIPFGVGPRNCIGSRFALLEAKVLFFHMLSKFRFEICEKSQVPLKFSKKHHFGINAEKGFWLALKSRH